MDQVNQIMAYEQGDLDRDDTLALFQELVNSGLVWQLQGHYGRTARRLLDAGLIHQTTRQAASLSGTAPGVLTNQTVRETIEAEES